MTCSGDEISFPDIPSTVDEMMRKRIAIYPCHSNRASAIGEDCTRRLVYERTHWREKEKHDVGLEYIFNVGNILERPVMNMLHESGFEIIRQQEPFEYRQGNDILLTGHIDGILVDKSGNPYVLEVKTMNPNIWESMHTENDLTKKPWTKKYIPQLHMYMLGLEIPRAIWILVNKSTGMIKQINAEIDYTVCEDVLKRCKEINMHVTARTIPDHPEPTIDQSAACERCPFKNICAPEIKHKEIIISIDDTLISEVHEMHTLHHYAKRYDELKKRLKEYMSGALDQKIAIGDYIYEKNRVWDKSWKRI